MKNITLTIFILIALSCQKEKEQIEIKPETKKQEITFAVTGFSNEVKDMNSAAKKIVPQSISSSVLQQQINQLAFVIYDEKGDEFTRKIQFSTDTCFGTYAANLPEGLYIAVILGSKSSFGINRWFKPHSSLPVFLPLNTARMMYEQANESPYDHLNKTDDTFFRKIMFTVYPQVETQSVVLERIVGKLEVNIEDVKNYSVTVLNEATDFMFDTETSAYQIEDDYAVPADNSVKPISLFVLRTDKLLNIEIEGGGIIKSLNVPIFKNKRTVVSGKLLAESFKAPLEVTVNDQWLQDTVAVKF